LLLLLPAASACEKGIGMSGVPLLDISKWITECGSTAVGQACTRTNSVCQNGFFGTVSGVCQSTGWVVVDGHSKCGGEHEKHLCLDAFSTQLRVQVLSVKVFDSQRDLSSVQRQQHQC
jgi:hypothetical protein